MELTLDPSLPRELPMQGQSGGQNGGQGQGQNKMAVPPGGRDPMNEENGTLPMDGSREVEDSAGLFLPRDLEETRGDIEFTDKDLHQQAIAVAKNKFKVWPSAVAGAYVTQKYKELYKRKHGSMEKAFKGKKQQAEYFQKQDAMEPLKTSGFILGDDEEAAFVSEEDIDAALNQWKDQAPEKFKDLLEAQDVEPS